MKTKSPSPDAISDTFDVTPVILAGGAGKRLWPLSRPLYPKPFLKLGRKYSFLQKTMLRTENMQKPLIIGAATHRALIMEQLIALGGDLAKKADILLEPCARNTAPAIACAAHYLERQNNPVMLVMPSDHVIKKPCAFYTAIQKALPFMDEDKIVTFGITPRRAATQYGYIQRADELENDVFNIRFFHEKPDKSRAAFYLKQGQYFWNSGIFMARASTFLEGFKMYVPDLYQKTYSALASASRMQNSVFLDLSNYKDIEMVSIDKALAERAGNVLVTPVEMGWSDIGTWPALMRHMAGM